MNGAAVDRDGESTRHVRDAASVLNLPASAGRT
jgi:hypothetical protein